MAEPLAIGELDVRGRRTENVLPESGLLRTSIWPPRWSVISRARASPRPVPSAREEPWAR